MLHVSGTNTRVNLRCLDRIILALCANYSYFSEQHKKDHMIDCILWERKQRKSVNSRETPTLNKCQQHHIMTTAVELQYWISSQFGHFISKSLILNPPQQRVEYPNRGGC